MAHIVHDPKIQGITDYDVEEYCPFCDDYIPVKVDENDIHGLEIVCPKCKHTLMLCAACPNPELCDWTEKNGCYIKKVYK